MALGSLMLDVAGPTLDAEDRELLAHPLVGGVILFSRNFVSIGQLAALIESIHAARTPPLLVAVDQEGGRVQRFRQDFEALPAAHIIGRRYDVDAESGIRLAQLTGWLMAAELRATGVDISFAPVLDLDRGLSEVIGDRAFHRDPDVVSGLAKAYMTGMREAGMQATGKHFPGHGAVVQDSHRTLPVDRRAYADIGEDLLPFERLIGAGMAGVMAAHVCYPEVDAMPASFSSRWLAQELRGNLDFRGALFSDDLTMEGAAGVGTIAERAVAALEASCDMILVCNNRPGAAEVVDALSHHENPVSQVRLARMRGRKAIDRETLMASEQWRMASKTVKAVYDEPEFKLDSDSSWTSKA